MLKYWELCQRLTTTAPWKQLWNDEKNKHPINSNTMRSVSVARTPHEWRCSDESALSNGIVGLEFHQNSFPALIDQVFKEIFRNPRVQKYFFSHQKEFWPKKKINHIEKFGYISMLIEMSIAIQIKLNSTIFLSSFKPTLIVGVPLT